MTLALAALLWLVPVAADDASAKIELIERLQHIETLRAAFVQRVLGENGEELQVLEGEMLARSPSHFRWEVKKPYALSYVLRDLDLTVVDPDLHQVTYRTIDSPDEAPIVALLLHRDMNVLDEFEVTRRRNAFDLEPVDEMQLFQLITVYFDGLRLDAIDVRDSQDRLTEFSFRGVEENAILDPSLFEVAIADDMEVIGEPPGNNSKALDDSL